MLVLRRRVNETVAISQVIKVTVLAVEGDRVKLGISAPPDVIVVREELIDQTNVAGVTNSQPHTPQGLKAGEHITVPVIHERH